MGKWTIGIGVLWGKKENITCSLRQNLTLKSDKYKHT